MLYRTLTRKECEEKFDIKNNNFKAGNLSWTLRMIPEESIEFEHKDIKSLEDSDGDISKDKLGWTNEWNHSYLNDSLYVPVEKKINPLYVPVEKKINPFVVGMIIGTGLGSGILLYKKIRG